MIPPAMRKNPTRLFAVQGLAILLAAVTALSCVSSGGGGATTPGPSGSFIASFTPDNPTPEDNTVNLFQAPGGAGNQLTINVGITGVNDVFGASFRIVYDPARVHFDDWTAGSLFEGNGQTALYQVSPVSPGVVEVGVSCAGCFSGIDVSSTETIVQMIFSAEVEGDSSMSFVAADLLDAQNPPGPIAGLAWDGGTLTAR